MQVGRDVAADGHLPMPTAVLSIVIIYPIVQKCNRIGQLCVQIFDTYAKFVVK